MHSSFRYLCQSCVTVTALSAILLSASQNAFADPVPVGDPVPIGTNPITASGSAACTVTAVPSGYVYLRQEYTPDGISGTASDVNENSDQLLVTASASPSVGVTDHAQVAVTGKKYYARGYSDAGYTTGGIFAGSVTTSGNVTRKDHDAVQAAASGENATVTTYLGNQSQPYEDGDNADWLFPSDDLVVVIQAFLFVDVTAGALPGPDPRVAMNYSSPWSRSGSS